MLMPIRYAWLAAMLMLSAVAASSQTFADEQAIIQFQRAADSYAFVHRQNDRRVERPPALIEGALFTPMVSAVFRARIRAAVAHGCVVPGPGADFSVPRVNASSGASTPVPACVAGALPRLPGELEYRMAGVALLLADAHLGIVVDVLHAAFAAPGVP